MKKVLEFFAADLSDDIIHGPSIRYPGGKVKARLAALELGRFMCILMVLTRL